MRVKTAAVFKHSNTDDSTRESLTYEDVYFRLLTPAGTEPHVESTSQSLRKALTDFLDEYSTSRYNDDSPVFTVYVLENEEDQSVIDMDCSIYDPVHDDDAIADAVETIYEGFDDSLPSVVPEQVA